MARVCFLREPPSMLGGHNAWVAPLDKAGALSGFAAPRFDDDPVILAYALPGGRLRVNLDHRLVV